jgi:hypothetical protein
MKQQIKILLGLWLVLCLYSCQSKVVTVRYEKRVVERYQVLTKSNVRHGYYKVYHDNGNVALEHTYNHGVLDGAERIYHEDGSLSGNLSLKNGNYEGPFVYYHPEGTVKQKGYYKKDVLGGELCSYYVNGKLKECVTMKNNMEQGAFREYAANGVLVRQGNYISILGDKEGLEDGLIYEYDSETRQLLLKKRCKEGFCCTIWERGKGYLKPSTSICDEIMNTATGKSSVLGSE